MALPGLEAADVTWDGGGAPNASGTWETGTNWTGDTIPGASDDAQLLDVTSGTRTVTISSGTSQSIQQLTMTQTTGGAVNVLDVNADLTLNGSGSGYDPFDFTPTAGQDSIVINVGPGATLQAIGDANYVGTLDGTLNLAANSSFRLESTSGGGLQAIINGPINVTGTNAKVTFDTPGYVNGGAKFVGGITVSGAGSSLQVEKLAPDVIHTAMYLYFQGDDGNGNSIKLETGTRMDIVDLDYTDIPFSNRVTLEGSSGGDPGAVLYIGSTTSTKVRTDRNRFDFKGGLALGEGAQTTVSLGNISRLGLEELSDWETGSKLLLQYRATNGNAQVVQSGTLTMDGATLDFDYVASSDTISTSPRNYQNSGVWTMKNGASVAFISSTGRTTGGGGGNNLGAYNNNSGTFSIESGSEIGFRSLYNGGVMNWGSSTAGVSDATVSLGSPDNTFTDLLFVNGATTDGTDGIQGADPGTLNVNGNTLLGRTTDPGSATLDFNNGNASSTGSVINVGDGAVAATLTVANRDVVLHNFAGNTVNLKTNGILHLKSLADNSSSATAGNITLTNEGTLVHAGTLVIQGAFNGSRDVTTSSSGLYQISGANATLQADPTVNGPDPSNVSAVDFTLNGQLSGAGVSDKLTYVNNTGTSARDYLTIQAAASTITPGAGSNGSGVSSIGSLELVDANLTLTSNDTVTFDIGGASGSGLFDEFKLTLATPGSGGILDLSAGNSILNIQEVNGYSLTAGTWQIITADSVVGAFGALQFNGGANSGNYGVTYLSNGVQIDVIPEPSAALLLLGGLATGLLVFRHRRVA